MSSSRFEDVVTLVENVASEKRSWIITKLVVAFLQTNPQKLFSNSSWCLGYDRQWSALPRVAFHSTQTENKAFIAIAGPTFSWRVRIWRYGPYLWCNLFHFHFCLWYFRVNTCKNYWIIAWMGPGHVRSWVNVYCSSPDPIQMLLIQFRSRVEIPDRIAIYDEIFLELRNTDVTDLHVDRPIT